MKGQDLNYNLLFYNLGLQWEFKPDGYKKFDGISTFMVIWCQGHPCRRTVMVEFNS